MPPDAVASVASVDACNATFNTTHKSWYNPLNTGHPQIFTTPQFNDVSTPSNLFGQRFNLPRISVGAVTGYFDNVKTDETRMTLPFEFRQLPEIIRETSVETVHKMDISSGQHSSSDLSGTTRFSIYDFDAQLFEGASSTFSAADFFAIDPVTDGGAADDCATKCCGGQSWLGFGGAHSSPHGIKVDPSTSVFETRSEIPTSFEDFEEAISSGGELNTDLTQILQRLTEVQDCSELPTLWEDGANSATSEHKQTFSPGAMSTTPALIQPGIQSRGRRSPAKSKRTTAYPRVSRTSSAGSSRSRRRHKHPCPYCEKNLDTKYKLERHIRTHTGEKPFQCEVCKTRFNQKSSLKTHSTIHAKALLKDSETTKEVIENYTVNGHTLEALGIPYDLSMFAHV